MRIPFVLAACVLLQTFSSVSAQLAPGRPARGGGAGAAGAQQVPLPYILRDSLGNQWDVQQDGTIGDGGNDLYDGGGRLFIGDNNYMCQQPTAPFDAARNEVTLPPMMMNGVNVSRIITVNQKGNWCRWVEIFENPGAAAVRLPVRIHFDMGGGIQAVQNVVEDKKTKKPVATVIFDGQRGIGIVGAGRTGAKVIPNITPQQNSDQVMLTFDLEVPPKQSVAIVHIQAPRQTVQDATTVLDTTKDKDFLADLPPDIRRRIVNFASGGQYLGDLEVLRGGLLDVVELRGGDQYRGTLNDKSYTLETLFGELELPADQVVGMLTAGAFRPTQLFVTTDGEVIGGLLKMDAIKLHLSSGQATSVPLHSINRLGYRKRPGEPEEWKFDKPMVFLRDGQRVGVEPPGESVAVATVYGPLQLKVASIATLVFQGEETPVHQMRLVDGTRLAGLVAQPAFDLKLRTIGKGKVVSFPTSDIAHLQLLPQPEDLGDEAPTLSISNGDVLVGVISGELLLETGFDTLKINAAEVRNLRHAEAAAGATAASPAEVQITLWDGATLSGRLKSSSLACNLKCGASLAVPVSLVDEYSNPEPQPGKEVLERVKATVLQLNDPDWKKRDRAADQLLELGPGAAGVLRQMRDSQPPEAQQRIDEILRRFAEARKAASSGAVEGGIPVPPAPVPDGPQIELRLEG